ncbi:energy-coupling factor transporter transmembrane protein EcfT [Curvibacter sp. CHRR-16]|uniref:energy-coupling factor transporter transmembrane component T family protein n=1 Tax=Curvibacter sp. CHRR-16 TaxID=2835872 RepID=UPI001BDB0931|nr:energy-coupling factor transporter transmembrane protein EcfT [Curvibacter sp. CHRR-16]MBT0569608.1 energy-coupling factor transporter transmembrane protein EcfT [Curvibacter sp. CHRR-16]
MLSLYSDHPSWLHRWPAGWKLACLSAAGTALFWLQAWIWLLVAFLASAAVLLSLGPGARKAWQVLKPIGFSCAIVVLVHALWGDLALGISSALRLLCTASLATALTLTTRYSDLLTLLEFLLRPLQRIGIRYEAIALQLALMLRFAEHFFVQWKRMDDAYRVRAGRSGSWRLMAPFTIQILRTAKQVADALRVRAGS